MAFIMGRKLFSTVKIVQQNMNIFEKTGLDKQNLRFIFPTGSETEIFQRNVPFTSFLNILRQCRIYRDLKNRGKVFQKWRFIFSRKLIFQLEFSGNHTDLAEIFQRLLEQLIRPKSCIKISIKTFLKHMSLVYNARSYTTCMIIL